MKRFVTLAAILALMAVPLIAQDNPGGDEPENPPPRRERRGEGRGGDRMGQRQVRMMLQQHDKNQDGALDKDELGDAELLKKLDKDENGSLNGEEIMADRVSVQAALQKKVKAQWEEEFKILDKDDSGKLNKEELGETHAKLLEGDKDDDKVLSKEEYLAAREAANRPGGDRTAGQRMTGEQWVKQYDKNEDGKVSKEEAPERLGDRFDTLDADKDGFITKEEFDKAMEAAPRRGEGPRRGDRRGPGETPEGDKPAEPPSDEKKEEKKEEKKPKEEEF